MNYPKHDAGDPLRSVEDIAPRDVEPAFRSATADASAADRMGGLFGLNGVSSGPTVVRLKRRHASATRK